VVDDSQSLFDEISDEVITTIPKINHADNTKIAKVVKNKGMKDKECKKKVVKIQQPVKKRQSERQKANWFKKPIIGPGSIKDQPVVKILLYGRTYVVYNV
jgi:hypothetical protein